MFLFVAAVLFGLIAIGTCWAGIAFNLNPDGPAGIIYWLSIIAMIVSGVGMVAELITGAL